MTSSLLLLTPARLCLDPRRDAGVFLSLFCFCVFVCVKAPTARYKKLGLQRCTQPTTCPCFVVGLWPGVAARVTRPLPLYALILCAAAPATDSKQGFRLLSRCSASKLAELAVSGFGHNVDLPNYGSGVATQQLPAFMSLYYYY